MVDWSVMKEFVSKFDSSLHRTTKKSFLIVLAIFLLGALGAFWLRFTLVPKKDTHYHANFALYVDGQRDEFQSFTFYEEVNACSGAELNNPHTRVHMHGQVNYVIHVHDPAATWGHFFANLGYTLGNSILATNTGTYIDGQGGELRFILNGQETNGIANQTIESEDVLLIDYGTDSSDVLHQRYDQIIKDAGDYNERTDPSACTGGQPETFTERVKRTLGLSTYN